MYIVAFGITYLLVLYLLKKEKFKTLNKKIVDDYFFWVILGLILGARIFSCLVYDTMHYLKNPIEILFPFRNGQFIGFQGMSFHGGVIGAFVASLIFARLKKIDFVELSELMFPAIPLGYTFGRLGNFINQELYGRITSSPIGMLFSDAEKLPVFLPDVKNVMDKLGWHIVDGSVMDRSNNIISNLLGKMTVNGIEQITINLPRHPSQLYEAFFEGVVLFLIVWFIGRKIKPFRAFSGVLFIGGYAIFRFFIEFLRQPDYQFANFSEGKYIGIIAGGLSMGQILCIIMVISAVLLGIYFYKVGNKPQIINENIKKTSKKGVKKKKK